MVSPSLTSIGQALKVDSLWLLPRNAQFKTNLNSNLVLHHKSLHAAKKALKNLPNNASNDATIPLKRIRNSLTPEALFAKSLR